MASRETGKRIDDFIVAERWGEARALIEKALKKEPNNHWLLTQLAETYYEQRDYARARDLLLRSREIVPDCPLTLWHLAGALDALGAPAEALRLYTWLLRSKKSPDDDPCWESAAWTDALKTDCVFRMGLCFEHLERRHEAAFCFLEYVDFCLLGMDGSYSVEDARKHLQQQSAEGNRRVAEDKLRQTGDWAIRLFGELAVPAATPPVLDSYGPTLAAPAS